MSALKSGLVGSIENPINFSKGCGGVMRVAPVGLVFSNDPNETFKNACQIAAITHGHPSGYLSAGVFASLISQLASNASLENSLNQSLELLKQWKEHEETLNSIEKSINLAKEFLKGSPDVYIIPEIIEKIGGGWTGEEALAIAIFCSLIYKEDFTKGVLASVNHSGDSDSTGSITGNILGIINGKDGIPQKWIDNLRFHGIVEEIANDLKIGCKSSSDDCDDDWWQKYPEY